MVSRSRRLLSVVWAVLQLVLPAAASLADAQIAARAVAQVHSHVEAPGQRCPPVHPADCAVCKQLSSPFLAARADAPALPDGRIASCVSARFRLRAAPRISDALPRAPPPTA